MAFLNIISGEMKAAKLGMAAWLVARLWQKTEGRGKQYARGMKLEANKAAHYRARRSWLRRASEYHQAAIISGYGKMMKTL